MIRPESLPFSWLSRVTDTGAWSRGRKYFRNGMAQVVDVDDLDDDTLELVGFCRGSAPQPYRQIVRIRREGNGHGLHGQCTCPVGANCKHVVALVLTWQALTPRAADVHNPIDDWLSAQPTPEAKADAAPNREAVLYLFDRSRRAVDEGQVALELRIARRRKDGSWAKGRPLSPSAMNHWWHRPGYLTDLDEGILAMLRSAHQAHLLRTPIPEGTTGHTALMNMVDTGRAFWGEERLEPLRSGEARCLHIAWTGDDRAGYRLKAEIDGGGELVPVHPPCYIDPNLRLVGEVDLPHALNPRQLQWLLDAPDVPAADAQRLSMRLMQAFPGLPTPVKVQVEDIETAPRGALRVEFNPARPAMARAALALLYDDQVVSPDPTDADLVIESDRGLLRLKRDRRAERKLHESLLATGLEAIDERRFRMGGELEGTALRDAWLHWLQFRAPRLREAGWQIESSDAVDLSIEASDGIDGEVEDRRHDWFSLRFDLDIDGRKTPLLPLIGPLLEHYRPGDLPDTLYLDTGRGRFVSVPASQIEPVLQTIVGLFDRLENGALQLARPDAGRLLDLDAIPVRGATSLKKLAHKLADFSGLERTALPTTFKGELRNYQQHGVDWLQFLREHGFGGILADDMGLGKTVQTLAHLAVEKRAGRMQHPSLIVAPTSLMGNWQREAAHFTPGLKVLVLHGPDRARHFDTLADHDLVLTTYPLLPRDREVLLKQPWHLLVLDEAQQLKNPRAQAAQVARKLDARHRLCLTGTPMENHLGELWAQFDLLMPGFLGDQKSFSRSYRTPIEKHKDSARLELLQRRIAPFLLRRTKDRVAAELPPKTELLRMTEFDPRQARLYESVRLTMEKKVRKAIAAKGLSRSHILVLDALLKLRQVCCDPRLLPKGTPGGDAPSAKFELLFDLLPELLEEGRRILLFSQFTTMLGLIEAELDRRQIDFTKLTGQTRKRDEAIQRFRSGEVDLFLISLKAGGVGLNLVEADTVIHYDPWWNPAVEHQATDRAHRIGQDKPVFVYKLLTQGTVEEKILALQKRKYELARSVVGKGREQDQPPIDEDTIRDLLAAD
ncbi:hypothetical protein HFP89_15670 [Wenzhouxiangella sp. XN79A]|uniref:DEAD/DEAH box helicase n=1 Tax=Wenzhouxiangella sp. XN79A TaxID=2724193 RepID=UPI00144A4DE0|nr:DEAD/DEAH box helicase [Wenzhouxiangella sp. XN79A]NKI36610.1 hypothetical protein [Wenzhouxiangella sp. XN79A]